MTLSLSGLHLTEYIGLSSYTRLDRKFPVFDHTLIEPSSPAVASDPPSCDHYKAINYEIKYEIN